MIVSSVFVCVCQCSFCGHNSRETLKLVCDLIELDCVQKRGTQHVHVSRQGIDTIDFSVVCSNYSHDSSLSYSLVCLSSPKHPLSVRVSTVECIELV